MKTFICILFFILILVGFVLLNQEPEYPLSRGEQLVNSTLAKTAKIIKNKYNLRPCGLGAAMPGGPIQKLALCFDTKYPLTKEELRKLLIVLAQELLSQVNKMQEIQPFIKDPPFTIKNVQIIIYNSDKNGKEVYDPGISTAEISQGLLTYQTVDISDTFKYKRKIKENYEDALKAISKR